MRIEIKKALDEQRLVFGIASASVVDGRKVIDWDGDYISPEELERAAYDFMEKSRVGKAEHEGGKVATVVESFVLTKAKAEMLGLPTDSEFWLIGMRIKDDAVWEKIKSGEFKAFSIGCKARRQSDEGA